ncbi:FHA domain-containing protein [bacterium]|nr:FHA domain-containing protein [bacterium]
MLGKLIPVQGGQSIYLTRPEVTVGSDEGCDVVIPHHSVEPLHCRLEYHDGTWFVEDQGTRTGVRVDGDRFDSAYIPVYSVLSIGTVQFEVHYRAGAPVSVGADSEASNVWPSVVGETSQRYSSGGRLTGTEDEVLLAPDDDSAIDLRNETGLAVPVTADALTPKQQPAFKRLGFLSPIDGETPHRLLKERLYLGRDAECDIVVRGLDVAPLHCVMELRDGYWYLRNLKTNGVAVDGHKLSEGWLFPGALLSICGQEFSVDYEPENGPPADSIVEQSGLSDLPQVAESADLTQRNSGDDNSAPLDADGTDESDSALEDLATAADELFGDSAEQTRDRSVAEATTAATRSEEQIGFLDDSLCEQATSKTFLLFEDHDEEDGADEPATASLTAVDETVSFSRTDQQSARWNQQDAAAAESETDFELNTQRGSQPELPELFDEAVESDVASNAVRSKPLASARQPRERSAGQPETPDAAAGRGTTQPANESRTHPSPPEKPAPRFPAAKASTTATTPGASPDLFGRAALVAQRHELLADYLDAHSLNGIILTRPSNILWFTAGADAGLARTHAAAVLITNDERTILCRDVDAAALAESLTEEMQLTVRAHDWRSSLATEIQSVSATGRFATDVPHDSLIDVASDLAEKRLPMSRAERWELRRLGHQVSHAVEATLRNFPRGETEAEIAGQLTHRLIRHGITVERMQVYADAHRGDYRRVRIDRQPVEKGCTLSVVARRHGLHVGVSRSVCFGSPDKQILEDHALSLVVQATALVFSKHQWPIADAWKRVHRIYEKFNRGGESLRVEPGWVTGYEPAEVPILPGSEFQLLAGMPVIWQLGVGSALSVDTVLIADGGIDILTPCEFWPTRTVSVKHVELTRPDILVRSESS